MIKPVYIGVDPAFRSGGFWAAILDTTDRTTRFLEFSDVLAWHDWLRSEDAPESAFVAVENSNEQNLNFDTSGNKSEVAKKGRNVGTNQAVSELAYRSAVNHYGQNRVFSISPRQKGRKYTRGEFLAVVRQDGVICHTKTNQDQRDAYKLATIAKLMAMQRRYSQKQITL